MENTDFKIYSFEEARTFAEKYLNDKTIPYSDLPDLISYTDRLKDQMPEYKIKEICDDVYRETLRETAEEMGFLDEEIDEFIEVF